MASDRRSKKRVIVYRARIAEGGGLWEVEYAAVADALHFACRDLREGRRDPIEILEDGVRVYDRDAMARECAEQAKELEIDLGLPVE